MRAARKALTQFDARRRLVRWPHKFSVGRLAMWVLWAHFEAKRLYTEREVNEILKLWNTWGGHVTLRRELINHPLLTRKSDCSAYRKLPARPDEEVRWLLRVQNGCRSGSSRPRAADLESKVMMHFRRHAVPQADRLSGRGGSLQFNPRVPPTLRRGAVP